MSIKLYKKVIALTAVGAVLSSPVSSFAEQQEGQSNQSIDIQEQSSTEKLSPIDEQALKSIEENFAGVDGRGISQEEVTDKLEPAEEETGKLIVPKDSSRIEQIGRAHV